MNESRISSPETPPTSESQFEHTISLLDFLPVLEKCAEARLAYLTHAKSKDFENDTRILEYNLEITRTKERLTKIPKLHQQLLRNVSATKNKS